MSRTLNEEYRAIQLSAPAESASTVTGTGQLITPGELVDACAIVNVGAVSGTPDSFTAVVTIEQSATLNGTYAVKQTFTTITAGSQIAQKQVILDPSLPYVRAKVTLAFTGGSTPKLFNSVALMLRKAVKGA